VIRRFFPAALIFFLPAAALAAMPTAERAQNLSPPMCATGEAPVVCELKIERNNALDDAALAAAKADLLQQTLSTDTRRLAATRTFWSGYTHALNDRIARLRHIDPRGARLFDHPAGSRSLHRLRPSPRAVGRDRGDNAHHTWLDRW
jgi:hypothetical protein